MTTENSSADVTDMRIAALVNAVTDLLRPVSSQDRQAILADVARRMQTVVEPGPETLHPADDRSGTAPLLLELVRWEIINVRTYNCLAGASHLFRFINDGQALPLEEVRLSHVAALHPRLLLGLPNFGDVSLWDIQRAMKRFGWSFEEMTDERLNDTGWLAQTVTRQGASLSMPVPDSERERPASGSALPSSTPVLNDPLVIALHIWGLLRLRPFNCLNNASCLFRSEQNGSLLPFDQVRLSHVAAAGSIEIFKIPNFGRKSLAEVQALMARFGYTLKPVPALAIDEFLRESIARSLDMRWREAARDQALFEAEAHGNTLDAVARRYDLTPARARARIAILHRTKDLRERYPLPELEAASSNASE